MGIMKSKIVEHLDRNGFISDYQAGFRGDRKLEENSFIVRYCIEEMYRKGRELVVVAIDFEKAFDSVGRVVLVRAIKFYGCDSKMIDTPRRNKFSGWAVNCLLCRAVEEMVEHFVVECGDLRETREIWSQRGCRC